MREQYQILSTNEGPVLVITFRALRQLGDVTDIELREGEGFILLCQHLVLEFTVTAVISGPDTNPSELDLYAGY